MRMSQARVLVPRLIPAAILAAGIGLGAQAGAPMSAPMSTAADTTRALTLAQCIDLAKKTSLGLRVAENALSSARLSRKAADAGRLPQVRLGGRASIAPTFGRFGYDPIVTDFGEIDAQIIAEQTVYDGGIYGLQTKQMQLDLESLGLARRITERDIVFAVTQVFVEILRAREEIALERQSLSQLSEYLSLVQNLYRSGRVNYTDVLKTEIQLSSARTSLQAAIEASTLATFELSELIHGTVDTTLEIRGSLDNMSVARIDTAGGPFGQSLESKSNELGIARSGLDVEIAHHAKYPTFSVFADAGLLTSLEETDISRRFEHLGYSAGVSVQVPLFDWGQVKYRERGQRLAVENARYEAEAFNRAQARELRSISFQIGNLERRIGELRKTMKDADDNYILTKSKYLGGAAPATEVLAAQQLVTDARLGELQARADALKLSARLEQIMTR